MYAYTLTYVAPLRGTVTVGFDDAEAAMGATKRAIRYGFTDITVNGQPVPLTAAHMPAETIDAGETTAPAWPVFAYQGRAKTGESVADSDKYGSLIWLDDLFTNDQGTRYVAGTWEDAHGFKTFAILPMAEVAVVA